jgi:hypothetical protein
MTTTTVPPRAVAAISSPVVSSLLRRHSPAPTGTRHAMVANVLTWAGSTLVVASSVVHFELWDDHGYRNIPTIGPLFLMQAVVGVVLALGTSVTRRVLLVLAEAGFILSTAAGLIISVNFGLFGWQESMSAPYAGLALAVELAAAALLAAATALMVTSMGRPIWPGGLRKPELPA